MGRRSRARRAAQPPPEAPTAPSRGPARQSDERPRAPWHPIPLVEMSVLGSDGGRLALLCGLVLASLGGLDTALREHFAGFRSHSSVLAGLPAVLVAGGLFFARAPWAAVVAGGVVTFAAAFWWFRLAFRRRSGGLSFR